jgi:hypothetical protein
MATLAKRTRQEKHRYLLFADILGTGASYRKSLMLTWRKRQLLDQILDVVVIRRLRQQAKITCTFLSVKVIHFCGMIL